MLTAPANRPGRRGKLKLLRQSQLPKNYSSSGCQRSIFTPNDKLLIPGLKGIKALVNPRQYVQLDRLVDFPLPICENWELKTLHYKFANTHLTLLLIDGH